MTLGSAHEMSESTNDGDEEGNDGGSKLADCIEFVFDLAGLLG